MIAIDTTSIIQKASDNLTANHINPTSVTITLILVIIIAVIADFASSKDKK